MPAVTAVTTAEERAPRRRRRSASAIASASAGAPVIIAPAPAVAPVAVAVIAPVAPRTGGRRRGRRRRGGHGNGRWIGRHRGGWRGACGHRCAPRAAPRRAARRRWSRFGRHRRSDRLSRSGCPGRRGRRGRCGLARTSGDRIRSVGRASDRCRGRRDDCRRRSALLDPEGLLQRGLLEVQRGQLTVEPGGFGARGGGSRVPHRRRSASGRHGSRPQAGGDHRGDDPSLARRGPCHVPPRPSALCARLCPGSLTVIPKSEMSRS